MFSKLAIALTDRCTASCDMCCFGCSPKGEHHLETVLIKNAIDEAFECGNIRTIGFTGGEPFIYYDQLLECASYANDKGMEVTINSNGFWGGDKLSAKDKVAGLKAAGVKSIWFSADRYHQSFVPQADLLQAMRVAKDAGLLVFVTVIETKDHYERTLLPELEKVSDKVIKSKLFPAGKAADICGEWEIKKCDANSCVCGYEGKALLGFDGNYYMCCSPFVKEVGRLRLGRALDTSIKDLGRIVAKDDYLYVMLKCGLFWYVQAAKESGFEFEQKVSGCCELCSKVFNNADFLEIIKEKVSKEADKQRLRQLFG